MKPFTDFPQAQVEPSPFGELCPRDFARHRAAQSYPRALTRPFILVIHSPLQLFPLFSLLSLDHSFITPPDRSQMEMGAPDGFSPCRPSTSFPHPHVLQGLVIHKDHGHPRVPLSIPKCLPLGDSPLPTVSRFMFSFVSLPFGILTVIKLLLSPGKFSLHQGQGKYLKSQQCLS